MFDFGYILMIGTVLGKLFVAAILGGIIGWERHKRGRPAGLRTHLLVCIGVTLMMLVSEHIFLKYQGYGHNSVLRIDPARIAAQVVTGIGFLGAGTIMRSRTSIRGLTTAASLWVVAGIGLAVGSGFILPAIFTTVIAMAILTLNSLVEKKMKRNKYRTIKMLITGQGHLLDEITQILEKNSVKLKNYKFKRNIQKNEIEYDLDVQYNDEKTLLFSTNDITKTFKDIKSFSLE
ncbi:MAG: MgtC/SapB family protein [Candidatus Scalindua sp.]|jgi:putative Mg2+ transporter-C (MgtC) family protein|nr:MgtC/SapB family protein [Candidatus Scalindua sp.]MBT5304588.1 MgtC/SapB family protein [Candidatus Scalindua sp.]MBT6049783.1 MgtC/SapB family protein [Candidatus Scalindua sp.]MBT6231406.1 MgtC/SapB family protein [Candidatus Scalindua sp.]MBT6561283.1 MgtC/SapB family protein [Candidatus Scalindua sp.]